MLVQPNQDLSQISPSLSLAPPLGMTPGVSGSLSAHLPISQWSETSSLRRYLTYIIICLCYAIVIFTFPFSLFFTLKRVKEYERAVVLVATLNRASAKGPGIVFVLPFMERVKIIDTRTKVECVPPQQIMSTDGVTLTVDAVFYYRVFDPVRATCRTINYRTCVATLASATLGSILGTYRLGQLLSDRNEIADEVQKQFKMATDPWGVIVERVEVKNLVVAKEMIGSIAIEAQANREAKGLMIIQKGEEKCLIKIKAAAEEMIRSPNSIVLKYLQVISNISKENNRTIVVPVPKPIQKSHAK